jgi:hypothetical protein
MLRERWERARQFSDVEELLQRTGKDADFLRNALRDRESLHELEGALRSLVERNREGGLQLRPDDPLVRQLRGLLENRQAQGVLLPRPGGEEIWDQLNRIVKEHSSPGNPRPAERPGESGREASPTAGSAPADDRRNPGGELPPVGGGGRGALPNTGGSDFGAGYDERLLRWAERLAARSETLRNSTAWPRVLENLSRSRLEGVFGPDGGESPLASALARRAQALLPSQRFLDENLLPALRRLPRPALPEFHLPALELGSPSLPAGELSLPTPTASLGTEAIVGLALIAAAAGAGLFGPRLYRAVCLGRRPFGAEAAGAATAVAFDPERPLLTRRDVVRAFELLSLRALGPEARSANHHAIAARLGGADAGRRGAATRLAAVYEQARYAPERDPLPPEALRSAWRELNALAGTAVS